MRTSIRLALALSLVAVVAAAQVRESITVSYVEVPVSVVDRNGNPIRNLTKANFEIIDEGKKRDVSSFDAIDFASTEAAQAISPLNPVARRNFLLLFDLSYSAPESVVRARDAARDFVKNKVLPRDRVGIATIDVEHGFSMVTAFTSDRRLVDEAIGDPTQFHAFDPLRVAGRPIDAFAVADRNDPGTAGANAMANSARATDNIRDDAKSQVARDGGSKDSDNRLREFMKMSAKEDDNYRRQKAEKEVQALAALARTLRSVTGQKHVVLLSEGFEARYLTGRTENGMSNADVMRENEAISHGEIWDVDTDQRYGNATTQSFLQRMSDAFKRSDVILHALDIRGIRVNEDVRAGSQRTSNEALYSLAASTGGSVFKNANDLGVDFERLLKQEEVVYVLGFHAPASKAGQFHNLKVKLVNLPAGARAIHRSGYYEAGNESAVERSLSTAEIVLNDIPQDAIHIAAIATPFATSSDRAQVPVVIEIDGSDLAKNAKGTAANAEIFVYAFAADGSVRDSLYQRLGLDLTKVGDTLRQAGAKYYGTLSLPPGTYAIKSLVRMPEADVKGYARTDVVVAAAGELAVAPPVFFDDGTKWVMVKGASHDKTNAAYPFEINGQMFIPSAAVHVKTGAPRKFAVFVQNASPEELAVDTTPKANVVAKARSANGAKVLFELPSVSAESSAVNVTVKKGAAEKTAMVAVKVE